jgi:hypothetical protein
MPSPGFRPGKRRPHFGHQAKHTRQIRTSAVSHSSESARAEEQASAVSPSGGAGLAVSGPSQDSLPLTYLPSLDAFFSSSMDIYSGSATFPPPAGNLRILGVNILLTGTFLEGSRNRTSTSDMYTHIILCDPNVEIRDGYIGTANQNTTQCDVLAVPAGQTNNYWWVIFAFIAVLPNLGRRKVIVADRHGTPGDWTKLL